MFHRMIPLDVVIWSIIKLIENCFLMSRIFFHNYMDTSTVVPCITCVPFKEHFAEQTIRPKFASQNEWKFNEWARGEGFIDPLLLDTKLPCIPLPIHISLPLMLWGFPIHPASTLFSLQCAASLLPFHSIWCYTVHVVLYSVQYYGCCVSHDGYDKGQSGQEKNCYNGNENREIAEKY